MFFEWDDLVDETLFENHQSIDKKQRPQTSVFFFSLAKFATTELIYKERGKHNNEAVTIFFLNCARHGQTGGAIES